MQPGDFGAQAVAAVIEPADQRGMLQGCHADSTGDKFMPSPEVLISEVGPRDGLQSVCLLYTSDAADE